MNLSSRDAASVWHPYTQHHGAAPFLEALHARGPWIHTHDGSAYLDMISSWWVNLHGHGSVALADAIRDQCLKLDHVQFAGVTHEPAVRLAERLVEKAAFGDCRIFYSDNGSTAVEVALKIAHQFWKNQGQQRPLVLALEGAYHGDTVGAMALGRSSGFFHAFEDLMFEIRSLPVPPTWYGHDSEEAERHILTQLDVLLEREGHRISTLIVEPLVQGAIGMRFHTARFLQAVCQRVRAHGILVIFDEVMTGFFRLGTLFAFHQTNVVPDMVCLSKGITGGILPLGATLVQSRIFNEFLGDTFRRALAHGHSFTGNPICCAAALANLDLLEKPDLPARLKQIHEKLSAHMLSLRTFHSTTQHRCLGTLAAFNLSSAPGSYEHFAGRPLARFAQQKGLLIRPIGNTVYFLPPYCMTPGEIDNAFDIIREGLESMAPTDHATTPSPAAGPKP
jgi:adenosylmethionine-8-amino-7-oxononanoate aminotransferase